MEKIYIEFDNRIKDMQARMQPLADALEGVEPGVTVAVVGAELMQPLAEQVSQTLAAARDDVAVLPLDNIDPQHSGEQRNVSAALETLQTNPAEKYQDADAAILIVGNRPDVDAVATLAIVAQQLDGVAPSEAQFERVAQINASDTARSDGWEPRSLTFDLEATEIQILSKATFDRGVSLEARVETVRDWLETGNLPERYEAQERASAKRFLASFGDQLHVNIASSGIATVSDFRDLEANDRTAGPGLGYRLSPIAIAEGNDPRSGERIVTIGQAEGGYADMTAIRDALREETGQANWNVTGGGNVVSCPKDEGSITVPLDRVVEIVETQVTEKYRQTITELPEGMDLQSRRAELEALNLLPPEATRWQQAERDRPDASREKE